MAKITIQHISAHAHKDSGFWQVSINGIVNKKFFGLDAKSDAYDYAKQLEITVGEQNNG